jgi:hypothetical protein
MMVSTANRAILANNATTVNTGIGSYLISSYVSTNFTGAVTLNSAVYLASTLVDNGAVSINSTLKAGNTSVNALDVGSDLTYKDTFWDDIRVPLTTGAKGGVKDPGYAVFGGTVCYAYHFDDSAEEELIFTMQIPHDYKLSTTMDIHIHYSPDTANTGNVVFGVDYIISTINGTFPASATVVTQSFTVSSASQYKHLFAAFTSAIPAQANLSSILQGRVYRAANLSGDTLVGDVSIHEIDFHYEVDSPGSRTKTNK